MQQSTIKQAIQIVQDKIKLALSKTTKSKSVQLITVSKTKPVEALQEAYDEGQRDFGENYVEEIVEKHDKLPTDIRWHFIGHLQSNKVNKVIVPNLYMLQTIDSIKLATKVQNHCEKIEKKLRVLVQIKTSDEDSKFGVSEEESFEVIEHIQKNCGNLVFSGIMTIGEINDMVAFARMYKLKELICTKFELNPDEVEVSMGMSADYEKAIEEGATIVRVGSTIFGARDYSKKNNQSTEQQQQVEEGQQKQEENKESK